MTTWIQLICLVQVLLVLARTDEREETSFSSDGLNVVCKTPGGDGGFFVDGMDVVAVIMTLMV